MEITTRVLELTQDADSPAGAPGFDRFWRNARILTAQASPPTSSATSATTI